MSKKIRTQANDNTIWKILEHQTPHTCPECDKEDSLQYLGFVETYSVGLHGKMFRCASCNAWVDLIWSKRLGTFTDAEDQPAGV